MARKTQANQPIDPDMSYEDAQAELEEIIANIESGEIGLEASIAAYERGVALAKHCREIHQRVEQKFTDLTGQMQAAMGEAEGGKGSKRGG
ncbi:MAG: exodeoxyribonuclease VII small subunit [Phycisphaeraceae bacterium]|nr:exodeoxyribonuclease VII small subunit [Phycisphaeraceae bacterium]